MSGQIDRRYMSFLHCQKTLLVIDDVFIEMARQLSNVNGTSREKLFFSNESLVLPMYLNHKRKIFQSNEKCSNTFNTFDWTIYTALGMLSLLFRVNQSKSLVWKLNEENLYFAWCSDIFEDIWIYSLQSERLAKNVRSKLMERKSPKFLWENEWIRGRERTEDAMVRKL